MAEVVDTYNVHFLKENLQEFFKQMFFTLSFV